MLTPEAAGTRPAAAPTAARVSAPPHSGAVANNGQTTAPAVGARQSVKCSFVSTPWGAEVTIAGQYAGSTPSVLNVSTGPHVLVVSLPGFAQWKRELTVSPGSELTVNAVLEKGQ